MEQKAEDVAAKMEALALHDDPAIALRGVELWLSRVYGKAVQPTQELQQDVPVDVEALQAMSTEERKALFRSLK